jgi:hypothetical protein
MFTSTITKKVTNASVTTVSTKIHSGDHQSAIKDTVADATVDLEYLVSVDVSELVMCVLQSSEDITVKTNDSGSPQETFNLVADKPVIFETGDPAIFSGDVSSMYVSNSSGTDATFSFLAIMATP